MPRKPKQPCAYPGCPNLSDGRYCEQHRKLMEKNYEQYSRDPAVHKKYGRAWKRIRDSYVTSLDVITMGLNFSVVNEGDTSKSIPRKESKGYDRESGRTN